jgi:hypothetical protein
MNKRRRARQGAAAGSSDGAVSSRLEGTPASPSARTFARASSGGLGEHGEQRCSNTRCAPRSRRGCPCPDLSGPPCSHARAPGLGTAGGCGIAMLAARRAPVSGPSFLGQPRSERGNGHHAGVLGFRVDGRSRRAVSGVRRKGAVVAVLVRRHLAGRLSANRRRDTAARAATRERERFRALLVGGRCSSSASSCSPFTRWVETAAWDLRGGCRCKAYPVEKPGAPEARWANAPPVENAGAARAPRVEAGEAA